MSEARSLTYGDIFPSASRFAPGRPTTNEAVDQCTEQYGSCRGKRQPGHPTGTRHKAVYKRNAPEHQGKQQYPSRGIAAFAVKLGAGAYRRSAFRTAAGSVRLQVITTRHTLTAEHPFSPTPTPPSAHVRRDSVAARQPEARPDDSHPDPVHVNCMPGLRRANPTNKPSDHGRGKASSRTDDQVQPHSHRLGLRFAFALRLRLNHYHSGYHSGSTMSSRAALACPEPLPATT
jgi:hypothetical protein